VYHPWHSPSREVDLLTWVGYTCMLQKKPCLYSAATSPSSRKLFPFLGLRLGTETSQSMDHNKDREYLNSHDPDLSAPMLPVTMHPAKRCSHETDGDLGQRHLQAPSQNRRIGTNHLRCLLSRRPTGAVVIGRTT